jgi:glycosyltransferase involved in cell wall biosynthesis
MNICLIFRKKNEQFFSIEKVFKTILPFLKKNGKIQEPVLPFFTQGFKSVIQNILFVRHLRADVFHVTGDAHYIVCGLPASKTVLTIHDCVFLYNYSGFRRKILKWLLLDMPVRRAEVVTTISENSRGEIIKFTKCDPAKIVVIPNPVSNYIYYRKDVFDKEKPVLLFIGSTPNKNLERSINAITGISCHLVIVGDINEGQRKMLLDAGISFNQVSGLSEQELADKFSECDIVLFPSTYEGFGLPIIEGQKAGRPVITSNISPMKEVAGEGACLVDPMDILSIKTGLERVIHDDDYRKYIVQKGMENINRYEPTAIAEQYLQIYNNVRDSTRN